MMEIKHLGILDNSTRQSETQTPSKQAFSIKTALVIYKSCFNNHRFVLGPKATFLVL